MTVVIFVIMLSIAVAFVARRNVAIVALAALWGFCLGMTPIGAPIAHILNQAGTAITGLFG